MTLVVGKKLETGDKATKNINIENRKICDFTYFFLYIKYKTNNPNNKIAIGINILNSKIELAGEIA